MKKLIVFIFFIFIYSFSYSISQNSIVTVRAEIIDQEFTIENLNKNILPFILDFNCSNNGEIEFKINYNNNSNLVKIETSIEENIQLKSKDYLTNAELTLKSTNNKIKLNGYLKEFKNLKAGLYLGYVTLNINIIPL